MAGGQDLWFRDDFGMIVGMARQGWGTTNDRMPTKIECESKWECFFFFNFGGFLLYFQQVGFLTLSKNFPDRALGIPLEGTPQKDGDCNPIIIP